MYVLPNDKVILTKRINNKRLRFEPRTNDGRVEMRKAY